MGASKARTGAARAVLAALLAAAALAALACAPGRALAADGSLTVRPAQEGGGPYRAYCAFLADVDGSGNAAGVSWPDAATRDAVLACVVPWGFDQYLPVWGSAYGDFSEPAAMFCAMMAEWSADAAGSAADPAPKAAGSFPADLAGALVASGAEPVAVAAGEAVALPQGYYLVVSDGSAVGAGQAASAPVWVAVGASTEVAAKEAAPSVVAEVRRLGTGAFARAADALAGQTVEYRVTATLPDGLGAFPSYPLTLAARLDRAGDLLPAGLSVEVGGEDVTGELMAADGLSQVGGELRASFGDLLSGPGNARAGGTVSLTFRAVKGAAPDAPGAAGASPFGTCSAEATYPADPLDSSRVRTASSSARLYSHSAVVTLTDDFTGLAAAPARYSLRVVDCGDASLSGKYVTARGLLQDDEAVLDNSGEEAAAVFHGLAAGTYALHQVGLPEGYPAQPDDVVIEVGTAYDSQGGVASLTAHAEGGYRADAFGSSGTLVAADAGTCAVTVASGVSKTFSLPVTGMAGPAAVRACAGGLALAGAALAAAGAAVRRRRGGRGE